MPHFYIFKHNNQITILKLSNHFQLTHRTQKLPHERLKGLRAAAAVTGDPAFATSRLTFPNHEDECRKGTKTIINVYFLANF